MLKAILPTSLLLATILVAARVEFAASSYLFPSRLYCSTTLYLNYKPDHDGQGKAQSQSINLYQVQEYLDLGSDRSSLSIVQPDLNEQKIYYYQVGPDENDERQFIVYDPLDSSCQNQPIVNWPLAPLRQIAIHLHDSVPDMDRRHIDVSIGPSTLLYAIWDNLSGFKYRSTIFSKSRLTPVDVHETEFKYKTLNGWDSVKVIVHVVSKGHSRPKEGETLDQVYDPDDTKQTRPTLDIVLVGACLTGSTDDLESLKPSSKRQQPKQEQMYKQLDEDTFCERDKLLFTVHYHIVADYTPGTLVSKSLDDFGQGTGYNFQREPFARPIGIGCWDGSAAEPDWQKSLSRDSPIDKFSAQYATTHGRRGVSFVAYGGQRRLLRLDWEGRKNIYDLSGEFSYHIDEFPKQSPFQSGTSVSVGDKTTGQCIVLHTNKLKDPTIWARDVKVEQLIGLDRDKGDHYLGSRMLDHVSYEVFEKELMNRAFWSRLPVIFRALAHPGSSDKDKRFFVTYYAQTMTGLMGPHGQHDKAPLRLSFIEVWEYDTVSHKRRLINRVKFLEFSWELDIEPADDAESQKPGAVNMRLFEMEPCYADRSAQGELVIEFRLLQQEMDETRLTTLKANHHLVNEQVHTILSNLVGASRLNLVDSQLQILDSGNLLSTSRIVRLRSNTHEFERVETGSYDKWNSDIAKILFHRYSSDECQSDSISDESYSKFAYSPELSVCLLLSQDEQLRVKMFKQEDADNLARLKPENQIWYMYSLKRAVPSSADELWLAELFSSPTELENRYADINIHDTNAYKYTIHQVALKQLDPIGARLKNDAALLSGLRYSTKEEEPSSNNMNERIRVTTTSDALTYCQLACQMDRLCGSFSVCSQSVSSGNDGKQGDCVLSSIRLTGERLNNIMSASVENKQTDKFEVTVTDGHHSQSLIMYRDDSCSLHPKDFLADYTPHPVDDRPNYKEHSFKELETKKRLVNLDDCAGLNFEDYLLTRRVCLVEVKKRAQVTPV